MSNPNVPQISKAEAIEKLWRMGNLDWKLRGKQRDAKLALKSGTDKVHTVLCSRRFGKCLAEGTTVITTKGLKNIEELKIGDLVYGYNNDGSISPTRVLDVIYQGEKEVVELKNSIRVVEESTMDHKWLTGLGKHFNKNNTIERTPNEFTYPDNSKILRYFINSPCGDVHEPHAYAIAALLGDGCSRQGVFKINISSEDNKIPDKVKQILNATYLYRNTEKNYTWTISNEPKLPRGYSNLGNKTVICNYYDSWCKGRYAHEKIVDLEVIKTWDRDSCLQFLAGLIDTDGSIAINNQILTIQFSSQSLSIIKSFQFLFHQLFQYKPTMVTDDRAKYVHGPCYSLNIRNNLISKRAVKELDKYLIVPRKKWKEEYSILNENNSNPDFIGIKLGNKRIARTWDIEVDNETHMYLTGNGLVTHNSHLLCCWAIEICLQTPRAIVKFATPIKEQAEEIITDIIPNFILNDCPKDLLPEWKEQKKMYLFPNGSKLKIAGANKDKGNSLKGGRAHLCIVDEAQDHNYLSHLVNNVLTPTTDTTNGHVVLCGTPNSREPEHEFHTDYILPLESEGKLIKFTVYDTWRYAQEGQKFIDELANRYRHKGGLNSAEFKCEYLCEISFNREVMVLPEFNQTLQDKIVKVVERPAYFDSYVGMDIGVRDLTGILFCYYDYLNGKLIVEDEAIVNGNDLTTESIKKIVVDKEKELWHDMMGNPMKPYLRIADNNNLILINDLQKLHGIQFITTKKDDKDAQINQLRMYLDSEKIIISPKCRNLIYQMRNVKWKGKLKEFARINDSSSGELKGGHADLVDALIYIVRNVIWTKNPYPPGFFEQRGEGIFQSMFGVSGDTKLKDVMYKIFNIKSNK